MSSHDAIWRKYNNLLKNRDKKSQREAAKICWFNKTFFIEIWSENNQKRSIAKKVTTKTIVSYFNIGPYLDEWSER
jgi:hypothetical protein